MSKQNPTLIPSIDAMISDALTILNTELLRLKTKTATGRPLDATESRVLQGYIKSLYDLSREDRERAKEEDLSKLTTEELLALLGNKAAPQLSGKVDK